MTATVPTDTSRLAPRRPALDRSIAMRLAATEYARFLAALAGLSADDWSRPTVCPPWDVRALAAHVLGMSEMAASIPEQLRQLRAARRRGGVFIDALTGVQVDKHAGDAPGRLVERFAEVGPRAAKGRRRAPGFVRRRSMPLDQSAGDGVWTYGYLIDVVLTRDTWMHRMDVAQATGRAPELTADHDGVLVSDVAAEWAGRHGSPCSLTLTGPAGGTWSWGSGGEPLRLDAVEFCRLLSGRGEGRGLLAVRVPF